MGTVTTMDVEVYEETVAYAPEVPLKRTEVLASKPVPVRVRVLPAMPEVGETVVIERTSGERASDELTVKFTPVEVKPVVTFLTVSE